MTKEKLEKANELSSDINELEFFIKSLEENESVCVRDIRGSVGMELSKSSSVVFIEKLKWTLKDLKSEFENL